jgi:uncharacterized membrane protein HdeD (DUF308 family)
MFMNLFISWWLFALRGLLALFFGILALIWPQQTVHTLVQVFGVLALADGILGLIIGIGVMGSNERWWMALLEGVVGIVIGFLILGSLDKITLALVYFIASGIVILGVNELVAAIQLRRAIAGEGAALFCAALSILLGVLVFALPSAGIWGLMWLVGLIAVVLGILLIIIASHMRSLQPKIEAAVQTYRYVYKQRRRLNSEIHEVLSRVSSNGNEEKLP